uniref:integrin alpha-X-like isoform X2 n=1 Tax=Myxine glutinosa TaxID=7769 RepID=UPI00358F7813
MDYLLMYAVLTIKLGVHVNGYNIDIGTPLIFKGDKGEDFGYKVIQHKERNKNWVLVSAPKAVDNLGKVYKCRVRTVESKKLHEFERIALPRDADKDNQMRRGLSFVKDETSQNLTVCGPTGTITCGDHDFLQSSCYVISKYLDYHDSFLLGQKECPSAPSDMVMLIDGSGSVLDNDFASMKSFIKEMISSFKDKNTQIAVVQYSDNPKEEFSFQTFSKSCNKRGLVDGIKQLNGETYTAKGINYVIDETFSEAHGARPSAKKLLVIITDGASSDTNSLSKATSRADSEKIERYVIGVGSEVVQLELEQIASMPLPTHLFKVNNYKALNETKAGLENKTYVIEDSSTNSSNFHLEMMSSGFSAYLGKNFRLFGGPGAYTWAGAVTINKNNDWTTSFQKLSYGNKSESLMIDSESYFGYSVGAFVLGGRTFYLAGAPRSNYIGQVLIFEMDRCGDITVHGELNGEQFGSYFGAELCVVDLEGDGNSDLLLVSAPLYHIHGDEGRVYVYSFQQNTFGSPRNKGPWQLHQTLAGHPGEAWSRFGSAIAELADLNGDGLCEVAVGAPYEKDNSGAVYIFHGRPGGLHTTPKQRILAVKIDRLLRLFGRSVYGKLDLNEDYLPDISIGSHGYAVILRARPLINQTVAVTFEPNKVPLEFETRCSQNDAETENITIKVCFEPEELTPRYKGTWQFELSYSLWLDLGFHKPRGTFGDGTRQLERRNLERSDLEKHCHNDTITMKCADINSHSSLRVNGSFSLGEPLNHLDPKYPCAMLGDGVNRHFEAKLEFEKNCIKSSRCLDDLHLEVRALGYSVILRYNNTLTLEIVLTNGGEDSYSPRLRMTFPQNLNYKRIVQKSGQVRCLPNEESGVVLECIIGSWIMKSATTVKFLVEFETTNVQQTTRILTIDTEVTSDSDHAGTQQNRSTVHIPVFVPVHMKTQVSKHLHLKVYNIDSDNKEASQRFELDNYLRPSDSVDSMDVLATLDIWIPVTADNKTLFKVNYVDDKKCKMKEIASVATLDQVHSDIGCARSRYRHITCTNVSLQHSSVVLDVNGTLFINELRMIKSTKVQLCSSTNITFDHSIFKPMSETSTTTHQLFIVAETAQVSNYIPTIIGATIGGLLLLALIAAILYKVGFFKRKKME